MTPELYDALCGLYAIVKKVLVESEQMNETNDFTYQVSIANMLALEGAVGDVERVRGERLVEEPDDHDRR